MEYQVCLLFIDDGTGTQLIDVIPGDTWDVFCKIEDISNGWTDNVVVTVVEA